MTNRGWPFDAVAGAPKYSGRALRQLTVAPFVAGARPGRPLGARSGVRPGTGPAVAVTQTTWSIGSHAGVLDVETAAEAGPYTYSIDASVSGPIDAANSSYNRTDILFAQLTDNAEDGAAAGQAGSVVVKYLAGNASAGTRPALPARSMILASISVPRAGGGTPTATWEAPIAVAAGAPYRFGTMQERDAFVSQGLAVSGDTCVVLGPLVTSWVFNGSRWVYQGGDTMQTHFTWSRANVDTQVQYPQLSIDTENSTDTSQVSFQRVTGADPTGKAGLLFATAGTSQVSVTLVLPRGASGRTFVQIDQDGGLNFARTPMPTNEDRVTVTGTVRHAAGQEVDILFYKTNGSLDTNTGRVIVTRVS